MINEPFFRFGIHIPTPKTFLVSILVVSYTISHVQSSTNETTPNQKPINKTVQKICNHTSNYSFCVKALYTDARTQDADPYTLAFVAVGMAYTNASATKGRIGELLKKAALIPPGQRKGLERCNDDYGRAAMAFALAYNDLNSETYFELGHSAGVASRTVDDCRAALGGVHQPSLLEGHNQYIKGFCEIVVVFGKLFTGEIQ